MPEPTPTATPLDDDELVAPAHNLVGDETVWVHPDVPGQEVPCRPIGHAQMRRSGWVERDTPEGKKITDKAARAAKES